jgi:non-ribosomal peptide synthetase component F
LPFERLVEALNPERDLGRTPLFQVMFNLLPRSVPAGERWGRVHAEIAGATNADAEAKYDLTLFVADHGDGYRLRWVFNTDLFDRSTVQRMAEASTFCCAAPWNGRIDPSPHSRSSTRRKPNVSARSEPGPRMPLPDGVTLHGLFEAAVGRTPDAPAVRFAGRALSYAELDGSANRLAAHLVRLGVEPGDRVVVVLERSESLVTAMLAALKAGAAWVPIEAGRPAGAGAADPRRGRACGGAHHDGRKPDRDSARISGSCCSTGSATTSPRCRPPRPPWTSQRPMSPT